MENLDITKKAGKTTESIPETGVLSGYRISHSLLLTYSMLILFFAGRSAYSQDRLFSQFYNAPLLINPAYTGLMDQDFRVQTIYRDQWRQLAPFKTIGVSADMTLPSYSNNRRQFAVGAVFLRDQIADFQVNTSVILSGSYRYILDQSKRHTISVGAQAGYVQKTLDYADLYFENQIGGDHLVNTGLASGEQLANNRLGYVTANAGLAYTMYVNHKCRFKAGVSLFNLNNPKEQYLIGGANDAVKLQQRLVFTAGVNYSLTDNIFAFPEVLFVSQQGVTELNLGSGLGYFLRKNQQSAVSLVAGGWYRTNGAAIAMLGFSYNNTSIMFTYDQIISDLKEVRNSDSVSGRAVTTYEVSLLFKGFFNRAIPSNYTLPCGIF